jgi:hypothetical protein
LIKQIHFLIKFSDYKGTPNNNQIGEKGNDDQIFTFIIEPRQRKSQQKKEKKKSFSVRKFVKSFNKNNKNFVAGFYCQNFLFISLLVLSLFILWVPHFDLGLLSNFIALIICLGCIVFRTGTTE